MANEWDEFRSEFFEEAAEHLHTMESALLELETASDRTDVLNRLFRAAHSIKGVSATLEMTRLAAYSHSLEDLLGRLRDGAVPFRPAHVDLLLRATDVLQALVVAERDGMGPPTELERVTEDLRLACENVEDKRCETRMAEAPEKPEQCSKPQSSVERGCGAPEALRFAPTRKDAEWLLVLAERLVAAHESLERAAV